MGLDVPIDTHPPDWKDPAMKARDLKFWAQIVNGFGYALLVLGTVGSIIFVFTDPSTMQVRLIAVMTLLGTWFVSAITITFGSFVLWRVDLEDVDDRGEQAH